MRDRRQVDALLARPRAARLNDDRRHLALPPGALALRLGADVAQRAVVQQLRVQHRHPLRAAGDGRSEEHTSELQSLMRTSYAGSWLKKKTTNGRTTTDDGTN